MQITLYAKGINEASKTLTGVENTIKNTQPLMMELSNHLYNISMDSFDNQRAPNGKAWTPLKKSTLK